MKKILVFALMLFVLAPSVLKAQTNTEPISCFDYYKFGSVYASLETKNYTNVSGTKINFFGEIKNENNYPIVDGKLFVKIMRQNDSYEKTGGQDEVDSFIVKERISISASSSVPISFDWQIPAYAMSGEYQVSTYFIIDDSFNMSGLSFTTDIVGGVAKFEVVGSAQESVYFDRTQITLNDNPYYTVAFTPSIKPEEPANISITLLNDTEEMQRVPVTIELYEWDSQAKKNLLDTTQTTYLLDPKSSIQIPYQVTDTKHSVYFLKAKASYEDAESEVSVRFGRQGKQEPRINFSTFANYPFEKGKENSLITCVHNTNSVDAEYGKVVTTVLDHTGKPIHTSTYEGKITSAIQGMISKFVPDAEYKNLIINTKIYDKNNNIIDETSVDYKCSDLLDSCEEPNLLLNWKTLVTAISLIILLSIILLAKNYLKKKDLIVCLAIMFALSTVLLPKVGEAKSVIWNKTINEPLTTKWHDEQKSSIYTNYVANGLSMSVKYHGFVKNITGGTNLNENSDVKPGDKLRFIFGSENFKDIEWLATGGYNDSPYGDWTDNADMTLTCSQDYFLSGYSGLEFCSGDVRGECESEIYGQFSVKKPLKTLVTDDKLSCTNLVESASGDYIDCTVGNVNTDTPITPRFNFSNSKGKFYFTLLYDPLGGGRCNKVGQTGWSGPYNSPSFSSSIRTVGDFIGKKITTSQLTGRAGNLGLTVAGENFVQDIATTTIPFSLKIKSSSTCASNSTSTISSFNISPNPAIVDQTSTFTFSATDPDSGQTITYQMEYDGTPTSVSSGFTKTWSSSDVGEHTVKIRAYDGCVYSPWTTQTITVNPKPTLPPAQNINAVGSCTSNTPEITITWDSVAGATGYEVSRDGLVITNINDSSVRTYTDNGVSKDVDYIYRVRAFNTTNSTESYSTSKTAKATCPTCNTSHYIGEKGSLGDDPPTCSAWQCDVTTWSDVEYNCSTPPPITPNAGFYFKPDIADSDGMCPLFLNVKDISSCTITKRGGVPEPIILPVVGEDKPVGTYTVKCIGTDLSTVIDLGSKSCRSNPDIMEGN